jgi:ribosomal protein S18 acetylase RimI-like enzyme
LDFSIISATWHDLGELRQLERECFGRDAWPLLDLIGALTFPGVVRLKAVVGGKMVGYVGGDPRHLEKIGWITTLGVASAYRRIGIATALLAACENAMKMPVIRLCVRRSNAGAQKLYQLAGYQPAGIWEKYYDGQEDALVLQKTC